MSASVGEDAATEDTIPGIHRMDSADAKQQEPEAHPPPSGKRLDNYGILWIDPPFLMGRLTISMAVLNSYVELPESIFTVHLWMVP